MTDRQPKPDPENDWQADFMPDPQTPATAIPAESCRSRGGANRIDYCVTHDAEWPVGHEFCDRITFPDIAATADQTPATEAGR